jgi:hemerythrin superfamily protein
MTPVRGARIRLMPIKASPARDPNNGLTLAPGASPVARTSRSLVRTPAMSLPTQILPDHHRHCDSLFAAAEEHAQRGDWARAMPAFAHLHAQMNAHFEAEEGVLFPAFEAATGSSAGPTRMMRHEHDQMRALLSELGAACAARDAEAFAGVSETLLMLMQQHNMKEENILYPMCDQALDADSERLGARMRALLEAGER